MSEVDLVVRARRVVTPDGEGPASVAVRDGRIVEVAPFEAADDLTGVRVDTLGAGGPVDGRGDRDADRGLALLPGLVDTHVHCNEPGRTHWEGFATATRAAAAGGITTLVDMPLNSVPPTTTVAALAAKRDAAAGTVHVDVGFWGGAVPENLDDLPALLAAGVFGVKGFLCPSGVDEFGHLDADGLDAALAQLARHDGLMLVHAEDPGVLARAAGPAGTSYAAFAAHRPPEAEAVAVSGVVDAVRRCGGRAHIVHVSSAAAASVLAAAHAVGTPVSGETCPHYLALAVDDATGWRVPDGAPEFKCCPPIGEAANRDGLWQHLVDGTLGLVVSDHSPSPPHLKHLDSGDLDAAWGGVSSLQVAPLVTWTHARRRGHGLADLARWVASGPADLAGLRRKGRIAAGADADLCVLDLDGTTTVDPAALRHRHPVTPYAGRRLAGRVVRTYLGGRVVHDVAASGADGPGADAPGVDGPGAAVGEPTGRLLDRRWDT